MVLLVYYSRVLFKGVGFRVWPTKGSWDRTFPNVPLILRVSFLLVFSVNNKGDYRGT